MERLTQKNINYCAEICRAQDCDTYNGVRYDVCGDAAIYNRLAAYEDAEEQGMLVMLPCNVGDTVYTIGEGCLRLGGRKERWICEHKPDSFYITVKDGKWKLSAPCEIASWGFEGIDEIGSFDGKFYVAREEAEKALEGMG